MNKRISTLVVIGFSLLITLGLGTGLFLYIKLQQRVDDAADLKPNLVRIGHRVCG